MGIWIRYCINSRLLHAGLPRKLTKSSQGRQKSHFFHLLYSKSTMFWLRFVMNGGLKQKWMIFFFPELSTNSTLVAE